MAARRLHDPDDPALVKLSKLLHATFADPDTVLELDRMQAFLAEAEDFSPAAARRPSDVADQEAGGARQVHVDAPRTHGRQSHSVQQRVDSSAPDRQFCVLVAEEGAVLLGGTVFSYVPATNCGFSEYLLARKDRHGQGIGRLLFDARRAVLDELARAAGQPACRGLFIEADNPHRTPPDLLALERETAMDALTRLAVFAHLGFQRVEIDYVQPPLGSQKQSVSYLDLLFAAWDEPLRAGGLVPAAWITETLCPIWTSWAPADATRPCAELRQRLGNSPVALLPLAP